MVRRKSHPGVPIKPGTNKFLAAAEPVLKPMYAALEKLNENLHTYKQVENKLENKRQNKRESKRESKRQNKRQSKRQNKHENKRENNHENNRENLLHEKKVKLGRKQCRKLANIQVLARNGRE